MKKLLKYFKRQDGSFSVEAILMFPMLVWGFMAMYVFYEGLRESNINLKATYTLSDLLSRQVDEVGDIDIDGMAQVYAWLSRSITPTAIRVSVVRYDQPNEEHDLLWSRGVGRDDLTQELVDSKITPLVPLMANASSAIVVETWTTYVPIMRIGLMETDIHNVVVTTPRFTDQLRHEDEPVPPGGNHDDGTDDGNDDNV